MNGRKITHPSAASTRRAIAAVESAGLVVGTVRLLPDGTIELVTGAATPSHANDEFAQLDAAGLL